MFKKLKSGKKKWKREIERLKSLDLVCALHKDFGFWQISHFNLTDYLGFDQGGQNSMDNDYIKRVSDDEIWKFVFRPHRRDQNSDRIYSALLVFKQKG